MLSLLDRRVAGTRICVVCSERSDGDVHPERVEPAVLARRQTEITGRRWWMLDQVHGTRCQEIVASGHPDAPMWAVGDVTAATQPDAHVAVWAADCAAVVLVTDSGRLVGVHAGWRGLASGVLDIACDALHGGTVVAAVLGPTIGACCYEFGAADLARVAAGVGARPDAIAGRTSDDRPALDVPAAVRLGLSRRGVSLDVVGACTGCDERWYSHRVRREPGRHATIAWMERGAAPGDHGTSPDAISA